MAQNKSSHDAWWTVLGILLLCVPLILSTAWGAYFSDEAFQAFLAAQSFAGVTAPAYAAGAAAQAPLYVGLLAAAADLWSASFAPQVALITGALGWGATALSVLLSLRAAGRPLAAIFASILIVINPLVITTAGTEVSWVLALGWTAVFLTVLPSKSAVWLKPVLLILLLALHFNAATILFALVLLAVDVFKGRAGWLPFGLVAAAALLWGLFMVPRLSPTGALPVADPLRWLRDGAALLADPRAGGDQLYWLYVPYVIAGLWDVWNSAQSTINSQRSMVNDQQSIRNPKSEIRNLFILLFLWAGAAVLSRNAFAPYIIAVTAVALAGLGAAWFVRTLFAPDQGAEGRQFIAFLVPLLVSLPLLFVSAANLRALFNARPVMQAELQDQAAAWLVEHAGPEATLYAPPRIGYMAERPTLPALVGRIRDDNVSDVYGQLLAFTPDYVVSENSFPWDYITRTTWFRDRYQERAQFADGYAPDAPVTVWEYVPSPYDEGERTDLMAVVDDRFALVGYQFEPQIITPGDDVYLTLYLQALEPLDFGFTTVVHLSAADDGWVWAWREEWTPRTISGARWAPGQIIPERIRLETTEDIPLGAYDLQVFWRAGDERSIAWPIVRDSDENVLDRIFLGHVNAPPPVDTSLATPAGARFSDSIVLDSFQISDPVPGKPLQVDLFWDAITAPAGDYTVFVHLLDEDGQIVAAHDSMPAENRFPTTAWKPGQIVSDGHQLLLPEDLAPGTYQVNVGLYLLETGERLSVWDENGIEQPDRALPLATVTVMPTDEIAE